MVRGAHAQRGKAPVALLVGSGRVGASRRAGNRTGAGNNTALSHDRLFTVTAARSALLPLCIPHLSALSPLIASTSPPTSAAFSTPP